MASTKNLLTDPQHEKTSSTQKLDSLKGTSTAITSPFNGFIKRFEDSNDKSMILYAQATDQIPTDKDGVFKSGVVVAPYVFEYDESKAEIASAKTDTVQIEMNTAATLNALRNDFFQVLTGDTRFVKDIGCKRNTC